MSDTDNKRYYWWKCNHEFFNGTKMKCLSKTYFDIDKLNPYEKAQVISLAIECIYIKLLSESCTHEGRLRFSEDKPYTDKDLKDILESPMALWEATKERLKEIQALNIEQDGTLLLVDLPQYIQSETKSAIKMRKYRNKEFNQCDNLTDENVKSGETKVHVSHIVTNQGHIVTDNGHISSHCPTDIRYQIPDIRNQNIEIRNDNDMSIVKYQFPLAVIKEHCNALVTAGSMIAEHVDKFADYIFKNAFFEKQNYKINNARHYLQIYYNGWKNKKLYLGESLKQITKKKAKEIKDELNKQREGFITDEHFAKCWNYYVGTGFKRKDNTLVTEYNFSEILTKFVELEKEREKRLSQYVTQKPEHQTQQSNEISQQELNNRLLSESDDD